MTRLDTASASEWVQQVRPAVWGPDDTPETACPKCGVWVPDHDGFGVLRHEACGYCKHPSRDGGVCGLCGDVAPTGRGGTNEH